MNKNIQHARDRRILEIVRGLLLSEQAFHEILKKYEQGQLHFSDVGSWVDDKGQSLLYNVKEQCHSLFRHVEMGSVRKKEWLLDLAIGSIFHEAMKLRENVYQLQVYRPKYLQYKMKAGKSAYETDYLRQFERIMSKAEQGVTEGMEETRSLFRDAMAQLVDFFKENAKNLFLLRFLLENETLLKKIYGSIRTKELFDGMFGKGLLDAYDLVGRSYLQSEHYDLSSPYFSKALKLDPHHRGLQFLLNFSLGMDWYYKNAHSKALSYFSKLVRSKLNEKVKKEYLRKAEEACHKIFFELKEERGLRSARKAILLADQIKKML